MFVERFVLSRSFLKLLRRKEEKMYCQSIVFKKAWLYEKAREKKYFFFIKGFYIQVVTLLPHPNFSLWGIFILDLDVFMIC